MQPIYLCTFILTPICQCHVHTGSALDWTRNFHRSSVLLIHQNIPKGQMAHLAVAKKTYSTWRKISSQSWFQLRQSIPMVIKAEVKRTSSSPTAHSKKMAWVWDTNFWSKSCSTTTRLWTWTTFSELTTLPLIWLMKVRRSAWSATRQTRTPWCCLADTCACASTALK